MLALLLRIPKRPVVAERIFVAGLEALIRHAAYVRLKALRGSELDAKDVPRRREKAGSKRRAA